MSIYTLNCKKRVVLRNVHNVHSNGGSCPWYPVLSLMLLSESETREDCRVTAVCFTPRQVGVTSTREIHSQLSPRDPVLDHRSLI